MEAVYEKTEKLNGVTTSDLLQMLQKIASQHQTELGSGREEMRRRGLLWMIAQQKLILCRTPVNGESVTIRTWLSEVRHGMYLRQYEIAAAGDRICRAAAIWTLVDAEKRTLFTCPPAVPFYQAEGQLNRFPLLRPMKPETTYSFTVPAAYLDENDHMNNARYFDAVAPILPKDGVLHTAQVDYHAEAREGESLAIGYAEEGSTCLIQAQSDRGLCFRMKLEYE